MLLHANQRQIGFSKQDRSSLQSRVPAAPSKTHFSQPSQQCSARCVSTAAQHQKNSNGPQLPRAVASLVESSLQSSNSSRLVTPEALLAEQSAAASLSFASYEEEFRGIFAGQQVSLEHEAERLQQLVQQLAQCRTIAEKVGHAEPTPPPPNLESSTSVHS
jgi:hypothetical protein